MLANSYKIVQGTKSLGMPITRIYQSSREMEEFEDYIGGEMQPYVSILQEKPAKTEGAEQDPLPVDGVSTEAASVEEVNRKMFFWQRITAIFDRLKNKRVAKNFN